MEDQQRQTLIATLEQRLDQVIDDDLFDQMDDARLALAKWDFLWQKYIQC